MLLYGGRSSRQSDLVSNITEHLWWWHNRVCWMQTFQTFTKHVFFLRHLTSGSFTSTRRVGSHSRRALETWVSPWPDGNAPSTYAGRGSETRSTWSDWHVTRTPRASGDGLGMWRSQSTCRSSSVLGQFVCSRPFKASDKTLCRCSLFIESYAVICLSLTKSISLPLSPDHVCQWDQIPEQFLSVLSDMRSPTLTGDILCWEGLPAFGPTGTRTDGGREGSMNYCSVCIQRVLTVSTWTGPVTGACRCSSWSRNGQTCVASPQHSPTCFSFSMDGPMCLNPPHLMSSALVGIVVWGPPIRRRGNAGDGNMGELIMGSDISPLNIAPLAVLF